MRRDSPADTVNPLDQVKLCAAPFPLPIASGVVPTRAPTCAQRRAKVDKADLKMNMLARLKASLGAMCDTEALTE